MELGKELGLVPADDWRHDGDPHAHWHAEHLNHHEDLKPAAEMLASAAARFRVGEPERAPYFYRYFCRYLDGREGGRALCEKVLSWERALIAEATIVPLGLRFVATLENHSP